MKAKRKKNMSEQKKRSSSLERKAEGYLRPTNHTFIQAYIAQNKCSKSAAINDAVTALRNQVQVPGKK